MRVTVRWLSGADVYLGSRFESRELSRFDVRLVKLSVFPAVVLKKEPETTFVTAESSFPLKRTPDRRCERQRERQREWFLWPC